MSLDSPMQLGEVGELALLLSEVWCPGLAMSDTKPNKFILNDQTPSEFLSTLHDCTFKLDLLIDDKTWQLHSIIFYLLPSIGLWFMIQYLLH